MVKVGIIALHKENEQIYDDYYKITSIYVKRLIDFNVIPIIIVDKSQFVLCDAFIIPGGNRIDSICYEVINYCIINNLPLLGICMGMQAMCLYDLLYSRLGCFDELLFKSEYDKLKKENFMFLKKLDDSHGGLLSSGEVESSLDNINKSIHNIEIVINSKLFNIYGSENVSVISMHRYCCDFDLNLFNKVAYKDGVLESIEYKDEKSFIIGVQYHIELEDNNKLFSSFIDKVKENKVNN